MSTILEDIVAYKKNFVAERKAERSIQTLEKRALFEKPTLSLKKNIQSNKHNSIIAEFKRHSPSKGKFLDNTVSPLDYISQYAEHGAVGVSILTDEKYFHGKDEDLTSVRHIPIPILRKDFIVDEYQIVESKSIGADVILLIASCLSKQEVQHLASLAKGLGLEILFEIHTKEETEKLSSDVDFIGINNRNLKTFSTDLQHSKTLFSALPKELIKVAESGIQKPEEISELKKTGFDAFLIGESLIKASNPTQLIKDFFVA